MTDPLLPGPLWLAGCGRLGSALLEGWLRAGVDPAHVTVVRPSGADTGHPVRVLPGWPEDEVPAIVFLAMKPAQLDAAAHGLAPILDPETILVSCLAGVELASLNARFPAPRNLMRAMPNLPVRIGKGVTGLLSRSDDLSARARVTGLMAALGHAEWFEDEAAFNMVTALSGSGPAFVFRFAAALAEAATELGLPADSALRLALCTVEGAGALAASGHGDLDALAAEVGSPGGTTEAGLAVLDRDRALGALVAEALAAARRRGLELAAAARPID